MPPLFLYTALFMLFLSSCDYFTAASILPPRSVAPSQNPLSTLFAETVVRALAPQLRNDTVLTAPRSGSVQAVHRATISSMSSCLPMQTHLCRPSAHHAFAAVGEARYVFNDTARNIRGRSTQALFACRCLSDDCRHAVLVRPVTIVGDGDEQQGASCLYEAVDGKFSECHVEGLRITSEKRGTKTEQAGDAPPLEYSVFDDAIGDYWNVSANRGWARECSKADISRLPQVDVQALNASQVQANLAHGGSSESACRPPPGVSFYVSSVASDGALCMRLYKKAVSMARYQATQQDCMAVGKSQRTYLRQSPNPLVSNTELVLSCAAAILGTIFLWTVCQKLGKMRRHSMQLLALYVGLQVLSFTMEVLPLFIVLGEELKTKRWASIFTFIDVAMALEQPNRATGGVLVYCTLVGEVRHKSTRVFLLGGLCSLFLFIGALITGVCITEHMLCRCRCKEESAGNGSQ